MFYEKQVRINSLERKIKILERLIDVQAEVIKSKEERIERLTKNDR